MTTIQKELVWAAFIRAFELINTNIHNTPEKQLEFRKLIIL